jgi:hypothetical protein
MAYGQRDPNGSTSVHSIPKAYAGVVLVALLGLIVLNRVFGSVTISGGVK